MMRRTGREGCHSGWGRPTARTAAGAGLALLACLFAVAQDRPAAVKDILPELDPSKRVNPSGEGPPLAHVDTDLVNVLSQAEDLIKKGSFDEAIQIIQALILREDSGFCPAAHDKRQFVSVTRKANELLAAMDPKGLKLYRTLYDPQAHQLYAEALESPAPERLLRKVAQRYLHTSYGPAALEALGAMYFDRARFSLAAACWRQLLPLTTDEAARAALLARIAAAHHLAGEAAAAKQASDELARKHPNASAVLGGRQQKLGEFLAAVRALPTVGEIAEPVDPKGWSGLGGHPAGLGRMADCDVVLTPRWRQCGTVGSGEDVTAKLQAGRAMYLSNTAMMAAYAGNPGARQTVQVRKGHLTLKGPIPGRDQGQGGEVVLPSLVHPVVAGEVIVARLDDCVVAYDLLTGRRLWESVRLPMVRDLSSLRNMQAYGYYGFQYFPDGRRYDLTVGGGRVYTVFDYLPSTNNLAVMRMQQPSARGLEDDSCLAAVLLGEELKLRWRIGRGRPEGGHEVLLHGKFLSPPTYHAGRLYLPVLHAEKYHLACLDAETGNPLWVAFVALTPMLTNPYGMFNMGADSRLAMGSPPAIADGRVYCTTNCGVIAAFDEETGQGIWAYQYSSPFDASRSNPSARSFVSQPRLASYPPANPVVISRGTVVCLPADCESVMAMDAETGAVRWSKGRAGLDDLSAIDGDRVLLSGGGLLVLRVADGGELFSAPESLRIHGRPAVTQALAMASAEGEIKLLDLKTYQLSSLALASPEGLLGNLVSADGKLISANMLGLCTYFSYEAAREQLTGRVVKTAEAKRAPLLLERGRLAFDARRFREALDDLIACRKLCDQQADTQTGAELRTMFYRTYVALGNHAAHEEMRRNFMEAASYAATAQEKARMLLRMALYHEKAGQYAKAAEAAQQLAEQYGKEEMTEVEIGPSADDTVRDDPQKQTLLGERIAGDYIKGLLEKYGRDCYAEYDKLAKEALDKAVAGGDPKEIIAVAKRWPNSEWADDALFAAAEVYYRQAKAQPGKADDYLSEARRNLYLVSRMQDSPLRISASAGLAAIYAEGASDVLAKSICQTLRGMDGQAEVSFADLKGKLTDVLAKIEGTRPQPGMRRVAAICRISPPLKEIFHLDDDGLVILRDQEYRPVRIGERVAVLKDGDAYLLDAAAANQRDALGGWRGLAGVDKDETRSYSYQTPGMRAIGAVSRDQKVLAVADRKTITGLEVSSAKVLWQKKMDAIGIRSFWAMGAGQGVLVAADRTGKVACVDLTNGNLLWQNDLVGGSRAPAGPPYIGGGMVVFQHNGGRNITCFSLAEEGRVSGKWEAAQWAQCEITADGLLVLLLDGELTVRELAKLDKPLWRQRYDAAQQPAILAVSSELVALSPGQADGTIEVLSIPGSGKKMASLDTGRTNGMTAIPFDAVFDGDDVYVLCSMGVSGRRKSTYGRLSSSRGVMLQKFDVSSGKRLWSRDLEDGAVFYPSVLPLVVGRDHVIVTARHHQMAMAYYAYVVESATGKVAQKIDLRGGAAAGNNDVIRRQGMGPPVMTDGRLILETSKGVSVHGDQ